LENRPTLTDAVFSSFARSVGWLDSYYLFFVCHILNLHASSITREVGHLWYYQRKTLGLT